MIKDMSRMQRIEVLMSTKMRKAIDKQRALTGESISGYLRKALQERVNEYKRVKKLLKYV